MLKFEADTAKTDAPATADELLYKSADLGRELMRMQAEVQVQRDKDRELEFAQARERAKFD